MFNHCSIDVCPGINKCYDPITNILKKFKEHPLVITVTNTLPLCVLCYRETRFRKLIFKELTEFSLIIFTQALKSSF